MEAIIRRLLDACRTNETQVTTVVVLTALNSIALLQRTSETPWWFGVAVLLLWPVFAFMANVIDPIPDDDA